MTDIEKQALHPEWEKARRTHDWRNYASNEIKIIWGSFTTNQKRAIVEMLDEIASREHWD